MSASRARLRNGLTVQGGTSTGRRLTDDCASGGGAGQFASVPDAEVFLQPGSVTNPVLPRRRAVPDLGHRTRDVYDPQGGRPGERDVAEQPGGSDSRRTTWRTTRSSPPDRSRSAALLSGGAANVTVNLIEPGTLYGDRRNNLDFRVAKIFRYGRTRTQIGLDIYNLTNTDVVIELQPDVRAGWRVADADADSAGAVRQDQRAVRLLSLVRGGTGEVPPLRPNIPPRAHPYSDFRKLSDSSVSSTSLSTMTAKSALNISSQFCRPPYTHVSGFGLRRFPRELS